MMTISERRRRGSGGANSWIVSSSAVTTMLAGLLVLLLHRQQNEQSFYHACHAFVVAPAASERGRRNLSVLTISEPPPAPRLLSSLVSSQHQRKNKRMAPALSALSKRELEIRRKIRQLKKDGKMNKKSSADDEFDEDDAEERDAYVAKIRQKLGAAKSKMLGFDSDDNDDDDDDGESADTTLQPATQKQQPRRPAQIGSLASSTTEISSAATEDVSTGTGYQRITDDDNDTTDPRLGSKEDDSKTDDDNDGGDLDEDDLVDLVAERMQEKRDRAEREKQARLQREAAERLAALQEQEQRQQQQQQQPAQAATTTTTTTTKTTSGVGGSWDDGSKTKAEQDMYQPKSGSWGAFPRPRDISKAYGGGRRVGPGYSNEKVASSVDDTRERLQRYRVEAGIDVESEKEHAGAIEEALKIASYAMQRGIYSTAVSALEKVTQYCSSNSKLGGKVFLELAMAYEAVGRTQEAITVYTTLSRSRIEEIKNNAKRLLYGIEAIQFMQENVSKSDFSRQRAKQTFIDTTGLGNIASHFDDVYETAYIDRDGDFYKKLTQSVVRSSREARQILLRATGAGAVERVRIVQALRSLNRRFADALEVEIEKAQPDAKPTAVMDGKPIVKSTKESDDNDLSNMQHTMEDFILMDPAQMLENLAGEWRLQLIADKRGDGVKFFNSTVAWQKVDIDTMSFASLTPQGFLNIQQQGNILFNGKRRILRRNSVQVTGGAGLAGLFSRTGAVGAISTERQVVTVDSTLLVTRGVPPKRGRPGNDDEKDYFAVWRRVEPGTYSSRKS